MGTAPGPQLLTVEEFLARNADERVELIRGSVVEKASPSGERSRAQGGIGWRVGHKFDRKPGGRWPGGWWFLIELDLRFGQEILRPDVCGFRRERLQQPPTGRPIAIAPDWVCEILAPSNAKTDRPRPVPSG